MTFTEILNTAVKTSISDTVSFSKKLLLLTITQEGKLNACVILFTSNNAEDSKLYWWWNFMIVFYHCSMLL